MADLFDDPLPERDRSLLRSSRSTQRRRSGQRRGKLGPLPAVLTRQEQPELAHDWVEVERYPYTTAEGTLVQEVIREECECPDDPDGGGRHKQFRQLFVTSTGRRVKRKPEGFYPVLYRAPRVAAAVRDGAVVWVLEGEKDVATAEGLGLVATTNTQGGRNFTAELAEELSGAEVVVVLDRDGTGWARGVDLHEKLAAVGAKVSLRLPAPTQHKADFTDHVEAGHALEDLEWVAVEEVATWHALNAAEAKAQGPAASLAQAVREAQARWELAEEGQEPEVNRKYAKRWVLETQIRQEALRDLVDQVYGHGVRVGTEWAGEAMERADLLLSEGTEQARAVHDLVGVAVPPSLQAQPADPAVAAENAAPGQDPPAGSSPTDFVTSPAEREPWGVSSSSPVFRVLNGQIVQWEPSRARPRRDDDDDAEQGKWKVLLSTVVKVTGREYLEVEDEGHDVEESTGLGRSSTARRQASAPRTLIAVRLAYPDPVTGEWMEKHVEADSWRDHSWLESLEGNPDYDHRKAGLDQLQRAILAISEDVTDEVLYRATGWREGPDGSWRFIHARGAITAGGHEEAMVRFSGPLVRYDLPDPVRDAEALRKAWLECSVTMLECLPGRVAAPLLGQVFRAVLGHNPWVLTLVGPPGSYKTSVAAKAMQHFGAKWEHKKPASSMSGNGDTFNALRFKLHNAKDTLYWMDDFAPTKSWLEAQKLLEETGRLIHNQEERSRSSRDGLSVSDGTGPRASGLCTSEVMPRPGSGSERMLVVPLAKEDIDTAELFPLDAQESRHGRELVMASYISWLAADLLARRTHYGQIADAYADQLVQTEGESVRQAAAVANTWAGWVAVTDFLCQLGAISTDERKATLTQVDAYLREAGRAAINPDMPRTTGARVRELLGYALRAGHAYVDDVRTGDCPPWPLAGRLGWRRTVSETDGNGLAARYKLERSGQRLGYVLHNPDVRERGRLLMCESTQLEAVLKAASATQAERLEIDRNTACRALHDEGVLIADTSEGRTRHTIKCRIYAEDRTARMVALDLDQIIGEDDDLDGFDGDDGPGPGTGPGQDPAPETPTIPGLDDPHLVDSFEPALDSDGAVTPNQGGVDGADHPGEEDETMTAEEFTSRAWTDRDGVVGWTEWSPREDNGPCVMCGVRCGVVISGIRIHLPCWEFSNAAEREAGLARHTPEPASAAPPAPAPAPTQNAPTAAPQAARGPSVKGAGSAKEPFAAAAAVVDVDGIWLSNGQHVDMPGQGPQHLGDLFKLAQWLRLGTQATKFLEESGQVWVGDELAARMGIDVEAIQDAAEKDKDQVARQVSKDSPAVTQALEEGYNLGGKDGDCLGRWTRVWQGSQKSVWVVLRAAMTREDADVALMRGDPSHEVLARRIGLLSEALGYPYHLSGSTTGLDLMKVLRWKDRNRLFPVQDPVGPAQQSNIETDLNWCRQPTSEELKHEWVHAYDRSGSYLAGVSGLELGVGPAQHHPEGTPFAARVPGYWRIEIPEPGDWRVPNPLDPRGNQAGRTRWVTTPALEFAIEQGYDPTVIEAYTWSEQTRILDPWYQRIRDARQSLDVPEEDSQVARDQLKQIYASTIGMLGSQTHMAGRDGYAPERRHMIIAKARTNILRRVAKIGEATDRWPVAIVADTVLYTSPDPDIDRAWPGRQIPQWEDQNWLLGRELGRYKPEGSARLEDHREFLTGGRYQGKDAIAPTARGDE